MAMSVGIIMVMIRGCNKKRDLEQTFALLYNLNRNKIPTHGYVVIINEIKYID